MSRPIESYFLYPSEYDPKKPSVINGYAHPTIVRTPKGDECRTLGEMTLDEIVQSGGTLEKMTVDANNELHELTMQSVANWPTADHVALISDIANVHPIDVFMSLEELKADGTILASNGSEPILDIETTIHA